MKQTVQELAARGTSTTTSSDSFKSIATGVVGKVWLKEIIAAAKNKMYFEQFAYVSTAPPGTKDVAVPLFTSNLDFNTTATTNQATTRAMVDINNLTTVVFTPTTRKFGAAIAKDVVRTSQLDTVKHAKEQMIYDSALTIDAAFDTVLSGVTAYSGTGVAGGSGTGTNAVIWGGDRAAEASMVAGDVLDTDLIAKANRVLKAHGWYPEKDKPFVLFIAPVSEEALLKDSQFVNASEYGNNEIVMNGEIGRYLGIKIISTNQVGTFTQTGGSTVNCQYAYMIKAKISYGIVYGEKPSLDFEYDKERAEFRVYLDMCYQCKLLQASAIQVLCVTDA